MRLRLDLSVLLFLLLNLMGARLYRFSFKRKSIFCAGLFCKKLSNVTYTSPIDLVSDSSKTETPFTSISPTDINPEVPKFESGVNKKRTLSGSQENVTSNTQMPSIPTTTIVTTKIPLNRNTLDVKTRRKKGRNNFQSFGRLRHKRSDLGYTGDQVIHLNDRELNKLLEDSLLIKIKEHIAISLFPPEEDSELALPSSGDAAYNEEDLFLESTKILPSHDIKPDIYSVEDLEYNYIPISSNSLDDISNRFVDESATNADADLEFIPIKYIGDLSSIVDQTSLNDLPNRVESKITSVNVDNLSLEVISEFDEVKQNVNVKPGIFTSKNKKPLQPRPSSVAMKQIENSNYLDDSPSIVDQPSINDFPSRGVSSLSLVNVDNLSSKVIPKQNVNVPGLFTSKNKKPARQRPSLVATKQIENATTDEDTSLNRQRTGLLSSNIRELVSSKQSPLVTESPVTTTRITTESLKVHSVESSNDDKPRLKKTKTSLFSRNRGRGRKATLKTTSNSNPSTSLYDSASSTISSRTRGNSIPDSSRRTLMKENGDRRPSLFSKAGRRNALSSSKGNVITSTRSTTTLSTTTRSTTTSTTTTSTTTTSITTRITTTSTQRYIDIKETILEPLEIFYDLTRSPSISTVVELVTTTIRPPVVESDTPVCPDKDSTFIIPHPDACDAFYLCQKGVVSPRFCPDNFIFSLTQALCVPAQSGDCYGRPERQKVLTSSNTVLSSTTSPVPGITCPDSVYNYIIPHSLQCDRFFICQKGRISSRLCPDGFILSISQLKCVLPRYGHGDCDKRPRLQPASGTELCVRQNGVFQTDSCNTFVTCRDNVPSLNTCSEGSIYDSVKKVCDWADEALRPGCLPSDFLDFRCPNPILSKEIARKEGVHLLFGDHDRHPDPTDCRFYFVCLTTGHPRRSGCDDGQVFSPTSKTCRPASEVPGCEAYYD